METFGRYILERRIAVGGMGELYLAHHSGIVGYAKKLVVKRIKAALASDEQFVEMFLNEGRVAALIDHPNVVHIYELGQAEGVYFIAMEYVPGRSLAKIMEWLGGPMELAYALYVMINICEGLAFAHDAVDLDGEVLNLVHRDISPPNILISTSGSVKISDFGIAKVEHHRNTAVGVLKGKFAYLSPEQARGEPVDRRSDIYALGLVLYEMTVGRRANRGNTDTGMIFAAAQRDIVEPQAILPDYPEELQRIFERATAIDVTQRYQHAKEMQEDLLTLQVDRRLVISAGRIGDWLRAFEEQHAGEEPEYPEVVVETTGPTTRDVVIAAPPAMAYDQTQAAAAALPPSFPELSTSALLRAIEGDGPGVPAPAAPAPQPAAPRAAANATALPMVSGELRPVVLEVDLEMESADPYGADVLPKRSTGRLAVVGIILLLLLGAGSYALIRWRQQATAAPAAGSGTGSASTVSPSGPSPTSQPASMPATQPRHAKQPKGGSTAPHAHGTPAPTPTPTPTPGPGTGQVTPPVIAPLPVPTALDARPAAVTTPDAAPVAPRPADAGAPRPHTDH